MQLNRIVFQSVLLINRVAGGDEGIVHIAPDAVLLDPDFGEVAAIFPAR